MIFRHDRAKKVPMFPGVSRRTLATGQRMMMTEFTYEPGGKIPPHSHDCEQISYVVEGSYWITIQDRAVQVKKGDSYLIPPYVEHYQEALEHCVTVDVFSPPREDYRESIEEARAVADTDAGKCCD